MLDAGLWRAVSTGLIVLCLAFWLGYMMGDGVNDQKQLGGLSSAQRNTAAAMIVATSRELKQEWVQIYTVRNGLITRVEEFAASEEVK